jgi:hypothetical protein
MILANDYLREMYIYVAKTLPAHHMLEFASSAFFAARKANLGVSPFHSSNDFYKIALKTILNH